MDISITAPAFPPAPPATLKGVGFGRIFTDRMFAADFSPEKGWHDARIIPLSNISLHPACCVFHYGAEVFEGLKAYRTEDGGIQLFCPLDNGRRLWNSCERMGLPQLPPEDFVEAVRTFVREEAPWVPGEANTSLYLRPFVFCTDVQLGVHGIRNASFYIIASPVGSYYPHGLAPVHIAIEREDVRAVRGGTGYAKCGGNYAAATRATVKAEKAGYDQVLWLDGVHRKYVEEVGTMNIMFKIAGEIYTAPLEGTVLPGVTRDSLIHILRDWGYKVNETHLSVDDLMKAGHDGTLEEAFGTGTAAVVSPVGEFVYKDDSVVVNDFKIGELTQKLYDTLTGIQWGKLEDKYGWTTPVE